jgi:type VI secretion system protein ImpH
MAAESGRPDPPLEDVLFEEGHGFDFFQAVRVLERVYPDRAPVGRDARPADEVVRFRSYTTLSFPPSAIHEITRAADGRAPAAMAVAFMGLTGPLGVLPRHYTELLIERARAKDLALRDFLDLFNHRLISLFYRAWQKYRFPVAYEHARAAGAGHDPFTLGIFDLVGMGTPGLRERLALDDEALVFYAGLLAQHPRSANALENLLADYFGVRVAVTQFVGAWLPLAEENRSRLGPGDANNVLGESAVIGSRVWDQHAKFLLRIGPLPYARFCDFLPSGGALPALAQLPLLFVGHEADFDVQLVLEAGEVPRCRLGDVSARAPRLGWSSWLKTHEFTHDPDDARLTGVATRLGALAAQTRRRTAA